MCEGVGGVGKWDMGRRENGNSGRRKMDYSLGRDQGKY